MTMKMQCANVVVFLGGLACYPPSSENIMRHGLTYAVMIRREFRTCGYPQQYSLLNGVPMHRSKFVGHLILWVFAASGSGFQAPREWLKWQNNIL